MYSSLKAEFLKLFTVRSTYIVTALALTLLIFINGYAGPFHAPPEMLRDPQFVLHSLILDKLPLIAILGSILVLINFSHEYRYNQIMHTLTLAKRRIHVLGAKIIMATLFMLAFTIFTLTIGMTAGLIGIQLAGHELAPQTLPFADYGWRILYYTWAYSMLGMIFVALTRSQVFAIVGFLVFPSTIEPLLGLLLKENRVYLPYSSIESVMNHSQILSSSKAALVSLAYIVGFWLISWLLFIRRDAN